MATERQKFMYNLSLKEYEELKKHKGEKLKYNYVVDGVQKSAIATLLDVIPFECIVHTGGKIPFVSREKVLREVVTGDGVVLYDRTFLIHKSFNPNDESLDLDRIKLALMGASQEAEHLNKPIEKELA